MAYVRAPSVVVDPSAFDCRDDSWQGRPWEEAALYELHVGTFGPDGKFEGVKKRVGHLADPGATTIGLMPLTGSPGRRNRRALLPAGALLHRLPVALLTSES